MTRKSPTVTYMADGQTRTRSKRRHVFGTVEQLPSGNYRAVYTGIDGHRYKSKVFDVRDDAERYRAKTEAEVRAGTWQPPATIDATMFKDYAATWVQQHRTGRGKPLAPRTKAEDTRMLGHGLSYFDGYALATITPALVRKWHAKRCKEAGATSAGNEARVLKSILSQALKDGTIKRNPVAGELTHSITGVEHHAPTATQVAEIIDNVESKWRAALYIAAYGGLRAGELSALQRRDVSISGGRVTINVSKQAQYVNGKWVTKAPKSAEGVRTLTLPEWLTPIVSRHLDTYVDRFPLSKLFSPARGDGYVSTATWGRILHKAMKSAGITTPMHWHDLRHFFGSTLAARGVGIKQLQGALGHATARASLIYLEPVNGMSADVADLMPKPSDSETKTVPFSARGKKLA